MNVNKHRARKKLFVIISDAIDPDVIPEELTVVLTLKEAEDVIELQEIRMVLGF